MRRLLCALAVLCAACSPSAPSPTYPSLLGTWTGTMDVNLIANGVSGNFNQCLAPWSIRTQNGGDFTGSFTTAPINGITLAPCAQSTSFSGRVSTLTATGANLIDVNVGALPAETPPGCTLTSQTPLTGSVSQYGTSLLLGLIQSNRFQCGTLSPVQFIRVTLSRKAVVQ